MAEWMFFVAIYVSRPYQFFPREQCDFFWSGHKPFFIAKNENVIVLETFRKEKGEQVQVLPEGPCTFVRRRTECRGTTMAIPSYHQRTRAVRFFTENPLSAKSCNVQYFWRIYHYFPIIFQQTWHAYAGPQNYLSSMMLPDGSSPTTLVLLLKKIILQQYTTPHGNKETIDFFFCVCLCEEKKTDRNTLVTVVMPACDTDRSTDSSKCQHLTGPRLHA